MANFRPCWVGRALHRVARLGPARHQRSSKHRDLRPGFASTAVAPPRSCPVGRRAASPLVESPGRERAAGGGRRRGPGRGSPPGRRRVIVLRLRRRGHPRSPRPSASEDRHRWVGPPYGHTWPPSGARARGWCRSTSRHGRRRWFSADAISEPVPADLVARPRARRARRFRNQSGSCAAPDPVPHDRAAGGAQEATQVEREAPRASPGDGDQQTVTSRRPLLSRPSSLRQSQTPMRFAIRVRQSGFIYLPTATGDRSHADEVPVSRPGPGGQGTSRA